MSGSISVRRLTLAAATPLAVVVFVWAVSACADFSGPDDATAGLPDVVVATPSLSQHIQPILDKRCAIGGCHSVATKQGGLDLTAGHTYANTVNVASVAADPTHATKRVVPGNADVSWLYRVLLADPGLRDGYYRMPLAQRPLTANQIATIRNWINTGAPNN